MPVRVTCACGKVLQGKDEDAGRQARCPSCGAILTLPASSDAEPWPPPAAPPPGEARAEDLPLEMARSEVSPSPTRAGKRYTCDTCGNSFDVNDVFEDDGGYICKRCHEREPPRRSSSGRSSRRDDEDDDMPRRRRRSYSEQVDNNLVWAILATLFCCLPAGIVAIVYAAQVDGHVSAGRIDDARQASANAATWSWVAFGAGLLWTAFVLFLSCASAGAR